MRPRSLSVACDRSEKFSKKFEGVSSDHEDDSDNDELEEQPTETKDGWSVDEYKTLVSKLRAILPKNDSRKSDFRLKSINWDLIAFDHHSADSVKEATTAILKKVRKYRTLAEVLEDMLPVVMKGFDSGKPKAPLSAYNFFIKANYSSIKSQNADLKSGEILKKLHAVFTALSKKKKLKYELMAEEAKKAYKKELHEYYLKNPDAQLREAAAKKIPKINPTSITPFNLFCQAKRVEGLTLSRIDLKKEWESMPMDQKLKFIREAYTSAGSKLTKGEKNILAHAHGKPELVPRTASEYYIKRYAVQDAAPRGVSLLEWRKQRMNEYKSLSKVRRLEVELEVRRARAEYVRSYQEYIESLPEHERQDEIQFLQSYMEGIMDKAEKKKYDGKAMPDLTGCSVQNVNEMTDLPIAESTSNDIEPKKKSKKKDTFAVPTINNPATPLKSILKTTSLEAASPKRKPDEALNSSKKKRKQSENMNVDSESDSSYKKGNKTAKKEKVVDSGAESSQETPKASPKKSARMVEPKRPPKDILKYYMNFHYHGRVGKHKESFAKLSTVRQKTIENEMRTAQKKYMVDLKNYLDHLPPNDVVKYVKRLKKDTDGAASADEQENGDDDEDAEELEPTKLEPDSSSSNSDGSESDD